MRRGGIFLLAFWILGCAGQQLKGTSLIPLAPAGITDAGARPHRYALLVGIDLQCRWFQ